MYTLLLAVFLAFLPPQDLTVETVLEGNKLVLSDGERIQLIGVDLPPRTYGENLERWAMRTSQEPSVLRARAQASYEYVQELAEDAPVRLELDRSYEQQDNRTPDGALLAYVYILDEDGADLFMLNERIVRDGFAQASPGEYLEVASFRRLEEQAREAGRGFWEGASQPRRDARPPR